MAVVNLKSVNITKMDAGEKVYVGKYRSPLKSISAYMQINNTDSIGSVYRLIRVSSSDRLAGLTLLNGGVAGVTSAKFGLYDIPSNGGAIVGSGNQYANAFDLTTGTDGTQIGFKNRGITAINNYVWEDAGLTQDPDKYYDICITLGAAATADGYVGLIASIAAVG
jgi:hypothetical protein